MNIDVRRQAAKSVKVNSSLVRTWASRMLTALLHPGAELSILLVDDVRMTELNAQHRQRREPTDVLSFPMSEVPVVPGQPDRVLGDIVISLDTAARQARVHRHSLELELRQLLAHGLLHLLGFDHGNRSELAVMQRHTRELVRAAGLTQTAIRPAPATSRRQPGAKARRGGEGNHGCGLNGTTHPHPRATGPRRR